MNFLLWLLNQMETILPLLEQFSKLLERYEHVLLRIFCYAAAITSSALFFAHVMAQKLFG